MKPKLKAITHERPLMGTMRLDLSDPAFERNKRTMILVELILGQTRLTKGKIYSLHAPKWSASGPRGMPTDPTNSA